MATISAANIATFAQDLVCDGGDSTALTRFATEALQDELPMIPDGWLGTWQLKTLTAGTATVEFASEFVKKVLAVLHGGRELSYEVAASLDARGATWQDQVGEPRYWTEAREEDRTIRLFPTPVASTIHTAGTIATERDQLVVLAMGTPNDPPKYLRLPLTLWVLAREYERESDHRDMPFAKLCRAMAEKYFKLADGVIS